MARGLGYESQWALIWRKFSRHRLGVAGGAVVALLYLTVLIPEFLAPVTLEAANTRYAYAPPQAISLGVTDATGWHFHPHVDAYAARIDYNSGKRLFTDDPGNPIDIGLFVHGEPYRLLGLIDTDIHLIGPVEAGQPFYLVGADRLGRDILSRTIYGTRISMTIGLIGVAMSLFFGILMGGISGYFGGTTDNIIQRLIEFVQSVPAIPLWIGLAAAIPPDVPPLEVYFLITVILSVIGWTGLARVVRGRFLAMRDEDFVKAARLDGASTLRILFRHMLPSFFSHIIAGGVAGDPLDDPGRDSAFLSRHRAADTDRQLGRAAAGGAERPHHRQRALAAAARPRRGDRRAVAQFPRRRPARCRDPYAE